MPKTQNIRRSYPAILQRVCNTPWQMLEATLQELVSVVSERDQGLLRTDEEIAAAIAEPRARYLSHFRDAGIVPASPAGSQGTNGTDGTNETASVPQVPLVTLSQGVFDDEDADEQPAMTIVEGVAILPVYGVLAPSMSFLMRVSGGTSTRQLITDLQSAAANKDVHHIVLAIDSPGGDAHGNAEVADVMRQIREKKPITAVVEGYGASAAYYIASQANQIVASRSAEIGSIGTYYVHSESSRAADKAGYTYTVFRAGENKNLANPNEALTDKAKQDVNGRLKALNDQFVADVAAGRGVSVETVRSQFGEGKLLLASFAMQAGLVDRIGTLAEVVSELRSKKAGPATPAAKGVAVTTGRPTSKTEGQESSMNPLLKQAVIAAGLVAADASDDLCQAALKGYFRGKVPEDPKAAALQLLGQEERITLKADVLKTETNASDVAAERTRVSEIMAAGRLLKVSMEDIDAAVSDPNMTPAAARKQFEASQLDKTKPVTITTTESEHDKFYSAAVDGLILKLNAGLDGEQKPIKANATQEARAVASMHPIDIGRQLLSMSRGRDVFAMDSEDVAVEMVKGDGREFNCRLSQNSTTISPANFPNILSAVIAKTLDQTTVDADMSYDFYAKQVDSVQDFNPKMLLDTGFFGELDLIEDGDPETERKFAELASWIKVEEYGNKVVLTPRILINDQLGVFLESPAKFMLSWEETKNRLCLDQLLTGKCSDGVALVHASHSNIIGTGGHVSQTTLAAVRVKMSAQMDVGGKSKLRLKPKRLLVPTAELETAEQYLKSGVAVYPSADTSVNTFRGTLAYKDDPLLDDNSTLKWYAFCDKMKMAAVIYTFLRGQEDLKRRFWFNNENRSREFAVNGTVGAAAYQYQAVVQSPTY